ncbi:MAG TPA: oligosaccharide flippase family protein [Tepidisphaeraceae bacterium]|nr:oligosaccharide flippase family protein [Tepidisphaeraceae bacterium]
MPGVPAPSSDLHERGRARARRVWLAIATSVLARALTLVVPLVCLPLFVRYLGPEGYGLYEAIGALAVWLTLANAGLYLGLQNRLQECLVAGDAALARRYVSSATFLVGLIALAAAVLVTVVALAVDWQRIFPTRSPELAAQLALAFWVCAVSTLAGLALGVPAVVYAAGQELHVANAWEMAARAVTIAASIGVVFTQFGLVGVVVATATLPLVVRLLNFVSMFWREKPELRPSLGQFDRRLLARTVADGAYAFVLQAAVVMIYQVDKLVIGIGLSPEALAPFAVVGRLFLIAYGAYLVVLFALWPAYGDALRRGDVAWVRRGVRLTVGLGCGGVAAFGVAVLALRPWLLTAWGGVPADSVSAGTVLALTATFVCRAWVDARTIALNSIGAFRPQVGLFAAHAVLNLALALALVGPFGVAGVAWATPASAVLTSVWGYPRLMRRHVYDRPAPAAAGGPPGDVVKPIVPIEPK